MTSEPIPIGVFAERHEELNAGILGRLPDPLERPWLTVREVAPLLQVDDDTVYAAIREGNFPCSVLRLGRQWRIPTAEFRRAAGLDADCGCVMTDPTSYGLSQVRPLETGVDCPPSAQRRSP